MDQNINVCNFEFRLLSLLVFKILGITDPLEEEETYGDGYTRYGRHLSFQTKILRMIPIHFAYSIVLTITDSILESWPKPKKELLEEMGIETDEDVGVKLPA